MITLKLWNSLSSESRTAICKALNVSGKIEEPYHHNFDYDAMGKRVKSLLECCNLQKDGSINVTLNIKPTYQSKQTINKSVKSAKQIPCKKSERRKWKFRRYSQGDPDGEWVWAYGYTEEEARREIEHDYWGTTALDCYGTCD